MLHPPIIVRRCLAAAVGWALLGVTAFTLGAARPRRVLVIHSFGPEFAPFTAISSGFRTTLAQEWPGQVEFHEVSLESALFADRRLEGALVEYLRVLSVERHPDLVVTFGAPAAWFWLRQRERLFPSTPSVLAAMDQRRLRGVDLGTNVTSVTFSLDLPGAVEHVLEVLPGTRNITVVSV